MWIAAAVSGAARISPAVPKNAPAEIVTTRISSGFIRSVAPIAIGCTMFCSSPFASRTMTSMGGLALSKVGYDRYLKFVWPYLAVVFVVVCAFIGIAAATS